MKQYFLFFLALATVIPGHAQSRKQCIDAGWQFSYGARTTMPTAEETASWRHLDLPHDWSVETEAAQTAGGTVVGPFSTSSVGKHQTGNTVGGEGWYKKTFTLTAAQARQLVSIYFEGVYNQSHVYINGREVNFNPYGYSSYRVDLTPYLKPAGQENTLLVKVQNLKNNTRWYAGSGIFRHVWLLTTPRCHLDDWGTTVRADQVEGTTGKVSVSTTVNNETSKRAKGKVTIRLMDNDDNIVAQGTAPYRIAPQRESRVSLDLNVANAHLWDLDSPYLYRAEIVMDKQKDRLTIPFGIRTLRFSAQDGFQLNGKSVLLRGGCVHHDHGLLGAASWDKAEERKVRLLKAQGYNALRCSHNLPSEHFLNACDSMGMLVMDECFDQWERFEGKNADDYHLYFPQYHTQDMSTMLRRDINHPSIIMWSIGNEIPDRGSERGIEISRELTTMVKDYDKSARATTNASNSWEMKSSGVEGWDNWSARAWSYVDVAGYNYQYGHYKTDHEVYPDRIIVGTESYPREAGPNWDLVESQPYVIGDFTWTAMDYLGEAGIGNANFVGNNDFFQKWPWFNGWCGDIDLIGQKKPQSFYRDVLWHRAPITMAVEQPFTHERVSGWGWPQEHQHWTWPEYNDSSPMNVHVYSRASLVRLYLNGKLMGETKPDRNYRAAFTCGYTPGLLRAVNVENGRETDAFELTTTSKPAAIRLTADRNNYTSSGTDLAYVTIELVDARGRVITSNSSEKVSISVSGSGSLLAAGTASPTDMASFRSTTPTLFEGRALAIVKTTNQPGDIMITVSSKQFSQTLTLKSRPVASAR